MRLSSNGTGKDTNHLKGLASYVHHLELTRWRAWDRDSDEFDSGTNTTWVYDDNRKYSATQNSRDKKLFQKAFRDLTLTDKKTWRESVRKDVDEVYVSLLILLTPNLKSLMVHAPTNPIFLDKALDHATFVQSPNSSTPSLQRIEDVSYFCRGNVSFISISHLHALFRLPAVRKLSIGWVTSDSPFPPLAPLHSLRNLHFHEADLNTAIFDSIFRACPNLESFAYQHHPFSRHRLTVISNHFHLPQLGAALTHVSSSLHELEVSSCDEPSTFGTLGSLKNFTCLRRLKMRLHHLVADVSASAVESKPRLIDILPSSLEELDTELVGLKIPRWKEMLGQVRELVDAKQRGEMSRLWKLGNWSSFTAEQMGVQRCAALETLMDSCRTWGIIFQVWGRMGDEWCYRDFREMM
ncbi:uncharacterized protein KY384_005573 [Bacidia gigantensis]|uniref:uncharacterized protein n=1 Tax=Bacidia gigantensis TaxID=2732470 RepID=UPI001D04C4D9|nr:uncharacterized protein KY384_005573 [Bacidia gigantensis]KAG8530091.1 hypothetical protein KY384_005573 [Bacidia gigantensis]